MEDEDVQVQIAAADALAKIDSKDKRAVEVLSRLLQSENEELLLEIRQQGMNLLEDLHAQVDCISGSGSAFSPKWFSGSQNDS